jgi:hypothetical protein
MLWIGSVLIGAYEKIEGEADRNSRGHQQDAQRLCLFFIIVRPRGVQKSSIAIGTSEEDYEVWRGRESNWSQNSFIFYRWLAQKPLCCSRKPANYSSLSWPIVLGSTRRKASAGRFRRAISQLAFIIPRYLTSSWTSSPKKKWSSRCRSRNQCQTRVILATSMLRYSF